MAALFKCLLNFNEVTFVVFIYLLKLIVFRLVGLLDTSRRRRQMSFIVSLGQQKRH
jgi:hypothetical protein